MMETILGFGFTLVTTMLGWCIAEVKRVRKEVVDIVEREKRESITAHRRLDVLDTTLSDLTEERLHSRNVVEKGTFAPRAHKKLMEFIHGAK